MFSAPWWIVDNTVIATVLALIVALVCRVKRVPPVVRHALWLVVLIKLIAPPLFPGPIQIPVRWQLLTERWAARDGERADRRSGILPLRDMAATRLQRFQSPATGRQALEQSSHLTAPADELSNAVLGDARDAAGCRVYDDGAFRSVEEQLETVAALPEAGGAGAEDRLSSAIAAEIRKAAKTANEPPPLPASPRAALSRPISAASFLMAGFLTATCAVIGVQILRLVNLRYLLTRARPAPGDFLSIVEDLAVSVGVRAPQVCYSADISSPLVCGFRRPVLLWPASRLAPLRDNALRAVILHELAHLARHDHLVGWLELVAGCLWWWNPLFWYVRHQLRETAELACDAWVMALIPEGRRDYARALVDLAEFDSRGRRAALALGVAEGSKNLFERRLVMIMGTRVRHRMGIFGILGTGLLALAALPGCTAGQASEESVVATEEASAIKDTGAGDDPLLRVIDSREVSADPLFAAAQGQLDAADRSLPSAVEEPLNDDVLDPAFDPPPGLPGNLLSPDRSPSSEPIYPVDASDAPTNGKPSNEDRLKRLEDRFDALLNELRNSKNPANRKSAPPVNDAQTVPSNAVQKAAKGLPSMTVKPVSPAGGNPINILKKPHRDGDAETIALTRATYKLPAAKAKAFAEFLTTHLTDEVEVRFKDPTLQVTASAEDQAVIAQFIRLLQARGSVAPKPASSRRTAEDNDADTFDTDRKGPARPRAAPSREESGQSTDGPRVGF